MPPFDPRLLRVARPVRALIAAAGLVGALTAVATVAQAVLLARVLAAVIVGGAARGELAGDLAALAGAIGARAILAWVAEELARRGARRSVEALRLRLLRHLAELGPRRRHGRAGAALTPLMTSGLDSVQIYLAQYLPALVLSAIVPAGVVVILLVTDLTSGLIVAVTLPLIPVFMALVGWYTDRETKRKWASLAALATFFGEVITGIRILVVYGRTAGQARAVREISDRHRRATMSTLRIAFLSSMVLELAATLSVALVAVAVGLRLVSGSITLAVALTALLLAPEAYLPLRALGSRFHAAADGVRAVDDLMTLLEEPAPAAGGRAVDRASAARYDLELAGARVDFEDGRGLAPVSLRLPAGRVTALTGASGSGKTTVLGLIAGLLEPDEGQVLAHDGDRSFPLAELDGAAWRAQIAWCGQHPVMLPTTIRANLLLGHPRREDVTEQRLWRALTDVAAAEFVRELPAGLDTALGDDGAGLSAGQLQRLGLARAVLRDAPIVVLDEPTAALDAQTERRVIAGMAPHLRGRTVALATHRPAPLAWADAVIELSHTDARPGHRDVSSTGGPRPVVTVAPW